MLPKLTTLAHHWLILSQLISSREQVICARAQNQASETMAGPQGSRRQSVSVRRLHKSAPYTTRLGEVHSHLSGLALRHLLCSRRNESVNQADRKLVEVWTQKMEFERESSSVFPSPVLFGCLSSDLAGCWDFMGREDKVFFTDSAFGTHTFDTDCSLAQFMTGHCFWIHSEA